TELEKHRKALEKERERILKSISALENNGLLNAERNSDLGGITTHPADLGTDNFERDLNLGLVIEENNSLRATEEALARIDKGSYGKCEKCGAKIEVKRLTAVPQARNCFECQAKMEF
ncbi:MAG: TraR/DksA C4-type zinc finger protein, partial [Candidatus Omnitrophica bacterium]|nr:TraR/DksA C4-type zinc finger protein [Candidatus Omnitrophota bacterium]